MSCEVRGGNRWGWLLVWGIVLLANWDVRLSAVEPFLLESYLDSGKIAAGIDAADEHLKAHPDDSTVRFGKGMLQVLRSVEHLSQGLYRIGLNRKTGEIPFPTLWLPVEPNKNPEVATYEGLVRILEQFQSDLILAERTLSLVQGEVKIPVRIGTVLLDLNGDGELSSDERFWKIYAGMNFRAEREAEEIARQYVIAFDTSDVIWLRGYCHLLLAIDEWILAHDWNEVFDRTARIFFLRVDNAYSKVYEIEQRDNPEDQDIDSNTFIGILDFVTFIHLLRLPVKEPDRMKSSLSHINQMLSLSREMFASVMAETDDDREWIPNPKQQGVIPGVAITQEMVDGWNEFLVESEMLFAGKKLIPHWRIQSGEGVNLRKVFEEPTTFDPVLWVHGSAAVPYLERGELTVLETWTRINRIFRGEFIGFAIWFN